ncbi:MAG: hypothetical protein R3323_03720 [Wenzhouxiangellaceae bacterium]|nr:hypothetical protein [Wenzhouxiangellaceae bacterium]
MGRHEDRNAAGPRRRRIRTTVVVLALTALVVYGGFVGRGVFGG